MNIGSTGLLVTVVNPQTYFDAKPLLLYPTEKPMLV
jgi:hypothetical protein